MNSTCQYCGEHLYATSAKHECGRVVAGMIEHALEQELFNLRTKLAAETKRADDAEARAIMAESGIIGLSDRMHTAEAQRDKLAELLRECFHDGLESYRLRDRIDAALAEMEGNK